MTAYGTVLARTARQRCRPRPEIGTVLAGWLALITTALVLGAILLLDRGVLVRAPRLGLRFLGREIPGPAPVRLHRLRLVEEARA